MGDRPKWPRLTIKRVVDDGEAQPWVGPTFQSVDVELNGHRLDHLRRLSLYLDHEDVNICRLEFIVGEVDIDAHVLALLGTGPEPPARVAGDPQKKPHWPVDISASPPKPGS